MGNIIQIWEEATKLHKEGKHQEAERLYDLILAQNPLNAGLLATMGTLYVEMGKYGLAVSLLKRALEELPKSDVLCNLAIAYKQSGQVDEAHKYFKKSIKKSPSAAALGNYAALFTHNGTPDEAIGLARKAIKLDQECVIAHWNMALALLEKGEWEEGWKEHEWGFKNSMRIDRKLGDFPVWDGTNGKTIVVSGEQGIGDEIMFASMLPDLMKNNTVIFECHQRLKHLFEESFPGLICYGTREEKEIMWTHDHKIDYRIAIGSLGQFFRNKREDFPGTTWLKAAPVPKGKKFRVGISWTGGLKAGRIAVRSVPLDMWGSILEQDCEFISLQYTDCADELAQARNLGYKIDEFDAVKAHDYYETAKLVKSCDLVISCCTSVIHLAGSLGVPCWVMVPSKPAWRYGVTGGMRWYRSVRLYRQQGDWRPVIERVGYDLSELLKEKSCNLPAPRNTGSFADTPLLMAAR